MSTDEHRHGTIRLGDIEYHPDTGRLAKITGEEVFLRAQSAHVLRVLGENAGNLVSKDRLISEVWRDVHVTDDSLTQCISDIRRAIGDKNREILQTVPKRGFILRVPTGGRASPQSGTTLSEDGAVAGAGSGHAPLSAAFTATAVIDPPSRTGGLTRTPEPHPLPAARPPQSPHALIQPLSGHHERSADPLPTIAVIPVRAIGGTPALDVVGEVVADDVISALSLSDEANVTSRLSTTVFKWRDIQLGAVGRALNADFVLSGSIAGDDERVILRLEFAEVGTNQVLWSDRIEAGIPSLITETDVSQKIVSGIRRSVELREIRRVKSNPLESLRDYSLLTGAVGLMHRLAPADFTSARTLLETLIERSPNHPSPLAWMARWHVLRVQQGWSSSPHHDAEAALDCARRALDIDPDNVLALTNAGFVLTNLLRRLDEAEERYDTALEVNPNDANGRLLRGALYAFRGDGERAILDSERALHLAPLDPHRFFFLALAAGSHLAGANYGRALELADDSLRFNRSHTSTLRIKTVAHMRLGQPEKARAAARELLRLQPSLRVSTWLSTSPSADFEIGRRIAEDLRAAGIPD
ncbi:winged helix-turn-helix domain-containing protein [Thalassobaculum sp.]|uniref:winged helix-turn-helix domain-containing tetratricopeptide repeat protein n=1 Tax=Thalassobaculum sp. TaxID=2022740 RepID=UPI0032EFDA07